MTRVLSQLAPHLTRRPLVVAHRGSSSTHPENTLAAFSAAIDVGAPLIEFDVQVSADQQLLCIHDESLDRTTNISREGEPRLVAKHTLAQITPLDAGAWKAPAFAGCGVPTLAEALALMRDRTIPMIEHKSGSPELYIQLLRRLGMERTVMLQSFDWNWLAQVARTAPEIPLGALGEDPIEQADLRQIRDLGVGYVHWDWRSLRVPDVARLHDQGLDVCIYTADAPLTWYGARSLGIDLITTNRPAELSQFLAQP